MSTIRDKLVDYRDLIETSTAEMVGREWVISVLDDYLRSNESSPFLILGEPGCGKTTLIAHLVQKYGYLHHFFGKGAQLAIETSISWRNPISFAESLSYQLLKRYGGWIMDWGKWGISVHQEVTSLEGTLTGAHTDRFIAVPQLSRAPGLTVDQEVHRFGEAARVIGVYINEFQIDPELVFLQLLDTPLRRIADRFPEHTIVLAVDGLDEIEGLGTSTTVAFLLHQRFPSNVRRILTSKHGEHLTGALLPPERCTLWLSADPENRQNENAVKDGIKYLENLFAEPQVKTWAADHNIDSRRLINRVSKQSGSNFLYLRHYAEGIRNRETRLLNAKQVPAGLRGIYSFFLYKIKVKAQQDDLPWSTTFKPLLGLLAVAREPLTQNMLKDMAAKSREAVASVMVQLKEFLAPSTPPYMFYHPSFGDFLTSDDNEDYVDPLEAHGRIADHYREQHAHDWTSC